LAIRSISNRLSALLLVASFMLAVVARVDAATAPTVKTVFLIVMENHNWTQPPRADAAIHALKGNPDAVFINTILLPQSSYAEAYHNLRVGLHPSEPNYIWMEAGTNLGVTDDKDPAINHQTCTKHLAAYLRDANISWRTYQEDIPPGRVPLEPLVADHQPPFTAADPNYKPKHNPFVFFDDMIGVDAAHPAGNPQDPYGVAHNRPLTELAEDLRTNHVARYNFITPNLFHDMHDSYRGKTKQDVDLTLDTDKIRQGDAFLAKLVPLIAASESYKENGAIFILWEETEGASKTDRDTPDFTLPLFILSPLTKGHGYHNNISYNHSSLLRTLQEIFQVGPWLGDAAHADDLSDLFLDGAIPHGTN
jgi:hypothetical protein